MRLVNHTLRKEWIVDLYSFDIFDSPHIPIHEIFTMRKEIKFPTIRTLSGKVRP